MKKREETQPSSKSDVLHISRTRFVIEWWCESFFIFDCHIHFFSHPLPGISKKKKKLLFSPPRRKKTYPVDRLCAVLFLFWFNSALWRALRQSPFFYFFFFLFSRDPRETTSRLGDQLPSIVQVQNEHEQKKKVEMRIMLLHKKVKKEVCMNAP